MERQENSIQFGSKSMSFDAFDLRSFIQTVLSVTWICTQGLKLEVPFINKKKQKIAK